MSHPLIEYGPFKECNALLHRLWTKAVGQREYDKEEWKRLGSLLERVFVQLRDNEICGAVYTDKEWPHRVVCVRPRGHTEQASPTWDPKRHRGHPESEAWEWSDDA